MKFQVNFERRFVQMETLSIEVEAKSPAEARKIAKAKMHESEITDHEGWQPSDSDYDEYRIDDVSAA